MALISKEDFVTEVMGVVPLNRLRAYLAMSNDSDERLKCVLLDVRSWARGRGGVFMGYHSVAGWIRIAYDDKLIDDQARATLRTMDTEQVLELIWDVKEHAQLPEEASAYLRERFASQKERK